MNLIDAYFDAITSRIAEIRERESEKIAEVARMCAESIARGGVVHIHDTGHMLNSELVHRAGGLALITPFSFSLNVSNPNAFREKDGPGPNLIAETISLAIKRGNMRPGDVLFIGSVSGKSESVVELAMQARAAGIKVVAVTSFEYSSKLESQHPSGKRLFEVADIALDNHAPYGDAMLEVAGLDVRACPASGIAAACIIWAVTARIIENLLQRGIVPTVFRSVNAPGGPEDVRARQERYAELGY
ncbi:MAG: sugar isomerase domain-containing protein [Armatimonadota bacterium]